MAEDTITLGARGVARICGAVGATWFLPYAHWWNDIGADAGTREQELIRQLDTHLRVVGASTRIYPWAIGSHFLPARNDARNTRNL
jgi:hypothetical protein